MDGPTVVTTREAFADAASTVEGPDTRVPVELRLEVDDPFEAYRRARDGPGGVFLETGGGQAGWGTFGVDPVERLQVRPGAVALDDDPVGPTLAAVDGRLAAESLARGECEVPYPCGAIGWLSYDVARELETLPASAVDDRGLPTLQLGVYDVLAAWRCPAPAGPVELHVTACPRVSGDVDAAYDRGRDRARALVDAIRTGDRAVGPPPARAERVRFESETGEAAFVEGVRRVQEHVRDGETFQVNLSHRLAAPAAVHPVEAYAALREVNPAPYAGLLEGRDLDLVSASPELLLEVDGDRVRTEPIAGTRPRGATPAEDRALEAELRGDAKERAEHAMLVDLERNDLGRVCAADTVEVTGYRRVDRYAEVMHLVSAVEGRLRPGVRLVDAVAAAFPGGTVTGAPKPRTMAIIDDLEATRRGPYTGSVFVLGFDGRATLDIVIRTLERVGEAYHLRVGAGVVHDSVPEREYRETLDKARALVTALERALDRRVSFAVGGEP